MMNDDLNRASFKNNHLKFITDDCTIINDDKLEKNDLNKKKNRRMSELKPSNKISSNQIRRKTRHSMIIDLKKLHIDKKNESSSVNYDHQSNKESSTPSKKKKKKKHKSLLSSLDLSSIPIPPPIFVVPNDTSTSSSSSSIDVQMIKKDYLSRSQSSQTLRASSQSDLNQGSSSTLSLSPIQKPKKIRTIRSFTTNQHPKQRNKGSSLDILTIPSPRSMTQQLKKNKHKSSNKEDISMNNLQTKKKVKKYYKVYIHEHIDYYNQIFDIIMMNKFMIIRYIDPLIKRKDIEKVSNAFINVLSYKEVILPYIKTMIRIEVENTSIDDEGTLFRKNNLWTGIISSYTLKIGKNYLYKVLRPCIEWLLESELNFEIDPNEIDDDNKEQTIRRNIYNLNYLANKFFKSILYSIDLLPFEIREISNAFQQYVQKKFPNSLYTVVGGYFFLRFVVPSVINPEGYGLMNDNEMIKYPKMQRALILVAKILQQIANNMKFNETHMEPLNELISKWTVDVHHFFDEITKKDEIALEKHKERIYNKIISNHSINDDDIDYDSFIFIHRLLYNHLDVLENKSKDIEKTSGFNPAIDLRKVFESMAELPEEKKKKKKEQ